jgi:hypothetical protein
VLAHADDELGLPGVAEKPPDLELLSPLPGCRQEFVQVEFLAEKTLGSGLTPMMREPSQETISRSFKITPAFSKMSAVAAIRLFKSGRRLSLSQ